MAQDRATLAEIYQGWENYQAHLVDALTPLNVDQLSLRLAANLRTIGQLAAHIVGARARWLKNFLGEGGDDLLTLTTYGSPNDAAHSAAELIAGLHATWAVMRAALDRWTADDLAQAFTRTRGGETVALSRRWVVWHLIEHDLHHGGELFFVLGTHGLPTPDI